MRNGLTVLGVIVTVGALLAGCTTGGTGPDPAPTGVDETLTITVGVDQEFDAYNNGTASTNTLRNQLVLNQVLPSFWEFDETGEVRQLEEFGSYEKVGDSPLTVRYTVNPEAVWSDGEPIDCDDYVLLWAARSDAFPDAGFQPANRTGYIQQQRPVCADGDKDFTVVYDTPYADWQAGFGGEGALMPAHIVEAGAGVPDLLAAVDTGDTEALTRVAQFWNTGWSFAPGALDTALTPSSGPYRLESWQAGRAVTLVANDAWWGTPPHAKRVILRTLTEGEQSTALRNGEIQVASPPANPDIVEQLKKEEERGTVEVVVKDQFTAEMLTFNFRGQFADPTLRRAFALCVPREQILEKLVHPVNPDAALLQSRFVFPFQAGYDEVAATVTDGTFDRADVEAARDLLTEAGRTGTRVRIGYQTPNQRRADTLALIRDSCERAGFVIEDNSSDTYFGVGAELDRGDFDVALFAWAGSALITGNADIYRTVEPGQETLNKGHYSHPDVDRWLTEVETETDPARQRDLLTSVDRQMWQDVATIPLFASPGLVAHRSQLAGVVYQPSASGVTWNMQEWHRTDQ